MNKFKLLAIIGFLIIAIIMIINTITADYSSPALKFVDVMFIVIPVLLLFSGGDDNKKDD